MRSYIHSWLRGLWGLLIRTCSVQVTKGDCAADPKALCHFSSWINFTDFLQKHRSHWLFGGCVHVSQSTLTSTRLHWWSNRWHSGDTRAMKFINTVLHAKKGHSYDILQWICPNMKLSWNRNHSELTGGWAQRSDYKYKSDHCNYFYDNPSYSTT